MCRSPWLRPRPRPPGFAEDSPALSFFLCIFYTVRLNHIYLMWLFLHGRAFVRFVRSSLHQFHFTFFRTVVFIFLHYSAEWCALKYTHLLVITTRWVVYIEKHNAAGLAFYYYYFSMFRRSEHHRRVKILFIWGLLFLFHPYFLWATAECVCSAAAASAVAVAIACACACSARSLRFPQRTF